MAAQCLYICHRTIERETDVVMEITDQLSTYTYVYINNYQNNIYLKKNEIVCFAN